MAVGLVIRDQSNNIVVDITDRVGRFTGVQAVAAGAVGSKSVPEFAQGQPFIVSIPRGEGNPAYAYYAGTTLYWRYEPGGFAANVDTDIHYGVY